MEGADVGVPVGLAECVMVVVTAEITGTVVDAVTPGRALESAVLNDPPVMEFFKALVTALQAAAGVVVPVDL